MRTGSKFLCVTLIINLMLGLIVGSVCANVIENEDPGELASDPEPLKLLAVSYYVLDRTFIIKFNNQVLPDQVKYNLIGFEINDSCQQDFQLSPNAGSQAMLDHVNPKKLRVNIPNDFLATASLTASTGENCEDNVKMLLEAGAFTDENGSKTPAVSCPNGIPVDIICGNAPFNHLIEASAGENGSISPEGDVIVPHGQDQLFEVTPDDGYRTDYVLVDGAPVYVEVGYKFENVTSNHTIHAVFIKLGPYNVTATHNSGGTVTPAEAQVEHGQDHNITITPLECFYIKKIKVDGQSVPIDMDPITGGTLTLSDVTEDHNVEVTFAVRTYIVRPSAGEGGTINPDIEFDNGCPAGFTFTLTPDECYVIDGVTVNGDPAEFTITNEETGEGEYRLDYEPAEMEDVYEVHVTFRKIMYTIVATAAEGGTIDPSCDLEPVGAEPFNGEQEECGVPVGCGECQTFTIIPDSCHEIDVVYIDGEPFQGDEDPEDTLIEGIEDEDAIYMTLQSNAIVEKVQNTYTFMDIKGDHTIHATFSKKVFMIKTHPGRGTIEPSGDMQVECGESVTFSFSCDDPCYYLVEIILDGESLGQVSEYTLGPVESDHEIYLITTEVFPSITATAGPGGEVDPSYYEVSCGSDFTINATPYDCYYISDVTGAPPNAEINLQTGVIKLKNITQDYNIHVTFSEVDPYTITSSVTNSGGTITPLGVQSVPCGADRTYTVTPEPENRIKSVKVDNSYVNIVDEYGYEYKFRDVREDHTIEATFQDTPYDLILMKARLDVCERILILSFNKPVDPTSARFSRIGADFDGGDWDVQMEDGIGLFAVSGEPYVVGGITLYPVMIDLTVDVTVARSLVMAAFVKHKCKDIELVMERGAFKSMDGDRNQPADIPLDMSINGLIVGVTGDVTGDGEVTAYDAAYILQSIINGLNVLPVYQPAIEATDVLAEYGIVFDVMKSIADTDGSGGVISSFDAAVALQLSAGFSVLTAPASGHVRRNGRLNVRNYDGQNLEVTIDIDNVSDVYSADIVMTYDPQKMKMTDVEGVSSVSEWLLEKGEVEGQLKISLAGAHQPAGGSPLVKVRFDAVSADAIGSLKIDKLSLNGGMLRTSIENLPQAFALMQNYPNPFNPETWIPYRLSKPSNVTITIYNLTGQMVRRLELGSQMPGYYVEKPQAAYWDGRNEWGERVSSGIYFYQLQADRDAAVGKMTIAK